MSDQFKLLFSPLKIGPVTIRNRIMSTAHATSIVDSGPIVGGPGFMGEAYAYYEGERAKGGAGLIICGQTAVHPNPAFEHWHIMIAYDKKAIPGFRLVTDAIHKYGATAFVQLFHSGANNALYGEATKGPLLSASSLAAAGASEPPKAMEIEDIEEAIEYYGMSAENAREGGFDGIEIHSTHGYLPQQFLSPLTNKRTDEYGGSLENRMRFLMRIIDRVKKAIGNDMALGIRLCGDELHAGGITPNDAAQMAQILEATGKVDLINVSVGQLSFARLLTIPPMYVPSGYALYASTAVRGTVENIPVAVTGRILDPVLAEKILADGNADIVGMTRALVADPELPTKAREGRLDEIRNCTGCLQECVGHGRIGLSLSCAQNPAAGNEKELGLGTLKPAAKRKKVLIAGGGPGGMEAAWVAAARGHQVTLYEKTNKLGGQINLACKFPGREEMEGFARWRIQQIAKEKVKVVMEQEVTPELVEREKPDAVIVATGSRPFRGPTTDWLPEPIPGSDQDNVVSCEDILEERVKVGQKVMIVDIEGRLKGTPLADMLSLQKKDVEYITPLAFPAARREGNTYIFARGRASKNGVRFVSSAFITKISGKTVTVIDQWSRKETVEEGVDTIVLLNFGKPNDELYFALKGKVPELYRIGDCVTPRTVDRAIHQGHKVGRAL